jgi:hypothetical protein
VTKGSLYVADYSILEPYEYPKVYNGMYCHAPIVLLYSPEGSNEKLPLGIRFNVPKQITEKGWVPYQENGKDLTHRIYTP